MRTFNSIFSFHSNKKSIVTIGTFDGVHIGHEEILFKIVNDAKVENCESIVLTFFPHPRMVLQENNEVKILNTIDEKIELFSKKSIDNLVIHPFDKDFSELSAEEFVYKVLVQQFNIQKIIIGHDHRFGKNRTANIEDLIIFGKKYNFEVEQISAQKIDEIAVSSTKIRTALQNGQVALAKSFLGYHYFFSGIVVQGNQLGRTIDFPTANLQIDYPYKLIPKNGVYIVKCLVNNLNYFGMMNIGTKPTVDGSKNGIEVFIFDFNQNIYQQKITIELLEFIREEQKFETLSDLKNQLQNDKDFTLKFIDNLIV